MTGAGARDRQFRLTAKLNNASHLQEMEDAQLLQRGRATRCQLKSCKLMHNCTKENPVKRLAIAKVNYLESHSRLSELLLFEDSDTGNKNLQSLVRYEKG